ncbi:MAG TPA: hypothetical protein VIJ96_09950 [Acidothermaceae bacterium]
MGDWKESDEGAHLPVDRRRGGGGYGRGDLGRVQQHKDGYGRRNFVDVDLSLDLGLELATVAGTERGFLLRRFIGSRQRDTPGARRGKRGSCAAGGLFGAGL